MSTGTQVLAHLEPHWAPDADKVALVMSPTFPSQRSVLLTLLRIPRTSLGCQGQAGNHSHSVTYLIVTASLVWAQNFRGPTQP